MSEVRWQYSDDTERKALIQAAQASGLRLAEDAITKAGKFLTFTDEPLALSFQERYQAATTLPDKLNIVAEMLGIK